MSLTDEDQKAKALRAYLKELSDQKRWNELAAILDRESKTSKLELWQLVTEGRAILLGDEGSLPLESVRSALEQALEREPDYVPAMIEMAHFLDTHEGDADSAVDLFRQATDIVLAQLLECLRGWAEARLLDDEIRRDLLRSYNLFLHALHKHGLEAGTTARRVDWFDPDEVGEDL